MTNLSNENFILIKCHVQNPNEIARINELSVDMIFFDRKIRILDISKQFLSRNEFNQSPTTENLCSDFHVISPIKIQSKIKICCRNFCVVYCLINSKECIHDCQRGIRREKNIIYFTRGKSVLTEG